MADYSKYINSTGTHYISNTGHDEHGKYHGGDAGDQGGEYTLRSWYNRPWTVVLRWPDSAVGLKIAQLACAAALNDRIGYDQYQRNTFWAQLEKVGYDPAKVKTKCETDCTASTTAIIKSVGHLLDIPALANLPLDTYSGNMKSRFVKAGFRVLTATRYLTGYQYLLPGDVLLYDGHHAAINVTKGKYAGNSENPSTTPSSASPRVLKNGMSGADVKALQSKLIQAGYSCGRWGADGDFGDQTEMAVRRFQTQQGLPVDGQAGAKTMTALDKVLSAQKDPPNPTYVKFDGNCYVRNEPSVDGEIMGVALEGATMIYGGKKADNGWLAVVYKDRPGWVSNRYGKLVSEA